MTTESIVFVWLGTDRNGQPSAGEEMASSAAMARAQLRRQGVTTKTVKRKAREFTLLGPKKITPADIAIFTRQLATMMKAGVPLVQAFTIVADSTEHYGMRKLINDLRTDVS